MTSAGPERPGPVLAHVTAIVLAGGRSSRFGSDKLAAELDGRPLLAPCAGRGRRRGGDRIVIVAAPGVTPSIPPELADRVRVAHDREPFGGPLAGLAAGLEACETATAVVVGGDMPRLVPAVLRELAMTVGPKAPAVTLEARGFDPAPSDGARRPRGASIGRLGPRPGRPVASRPAARPRGALDPASAWRGLDPNGNTLADIDRPADLGR